MKGSGHTEASCEVPIHRTGQSVGDAPPWRSVHLARRVGDQVAHALKYQSRCVTIAGRGHCAISAFVRCVVWLTRRDYKRCAESVDLPASGYVVKSMHAGRTPESKRCQRLARPIGRTGGTALNRERASMKGCRSAHFQFVTRARVYKRYLDGRVR